MQEAIVLAGGLGTRLRSAVNDVPKVMAPVAGKPFLHYIIEKLIGHGIKKIILATGYKHEVIENYIHMSGYNASIILSNETEPLGTGGGIQLALHNTVSPNIFIINGDTFFDIDLKGLMQKHLDSDSDITLALKPMEKFDRYGTVSMEGDRIIAFNEKKYCEKGLINAGTYIMKKNTLEQLKLPAKFSLETEVFEAKVNELKISGVVYNNYFIDIGIPEDYEKAQKDFSGK